VSGQFTDSWNVIHNPVSGQSVILCRCRLSLSYIIQVNGPQTRNTCASSAQY